ncbi:MAG: hypothetical protein CYPHOPRED_001360 [Cyphobasidiales sp. Tagirdzhanova-0007]|nr:MAG: hypothetical protein CYPHOPRED_001360 [Cyphobasidiales sp. Tagirdzhanova-0007]
MQRATSTVRPALRAAVISKAPIPKAAARRYATAPEPAAGSSHVFAGLAGGGVVLAGIYGYYHFSGAKTAVNTVKQLSSATNDLKEKAKASTPSPKAMLGFVRSAAISYTAAFPGASHLVNSTFDQIDEVAEKNAPEVEKIVKQVYGNISKAVSEGGDKVSDKIMAAVQEAVNEIQQLSGKLSSSALKPYLDKNPQLKSAVDDSLKKMQEFGDKFGPEAKKIADDTVQQIKELADKGLTTETIMKASTLAKEKLKQIQELGGKASSEAYSKAAEGAKPYLDKAPDVKKYIEDSLGGLKEYVGDDGVKLINDTYSEIEAAGKKGDTKALMQIARERIGQLQDLAKNKGGDIASKATEKAGGIPGMDKLFQSVPNLKDIDQLRQLAQEKGGDFEKLLNETYDELKSVLENKGKQAKDLSGNAVSEAKDKAGK